MSMSRIVSPGVGTSAGSLCIDVGDLACQTCHV